MFGSPRNLQFCLSILCNYFCLETAFAMDLEASKVVTPLTHVQQACVTAVNNLDVSKSIASLRDCSHNFGRVQVRNFESFFSVLLLVFSLLIIRFASRNHRHGWKGTENR